MRLLVLVNPGAARAEALEEIAAWFRQNCQATFVTTSSEDHLAQALLRHGHKADRIVIGGGDGTISKALPELLALGKPLAVLPLGTANDFARCLGLPHDRIAAARIALHRRVHQVDVGLVNGKPFVNVASVGVAAEVSQAQSQGLKRTWRLLSTRSVFCAWRSDRALSMSNSPSMTPFPGRAGSTKSASGTVVTMAGG